MTLGEQLKYGGLRRKRLGLSPIVSSDVADRDAVIKAVFPGVADPEDIMTMAGEAPTLFMDEARRNKATGSDINSLLTAMGMPVQDADQLAAWYDQQNDATIAKAREDEIFGAVFPGQDKNQVVQNATQDFGTFLNNVRSQGRNVNTEGLLRLLGYSDEDISQIYPTEPIPSLRGIGMTPPTGEPVGGKAVQGIPVGLKTLEGPTTEPIPQVSGAVTGPQPVPNVPTTLTGKAISSFYAGMGDVVSTGGAVLAWMGDDKSAQTLRDIGKGLQGLAPVDTTGEFDAADLLNPDYYATKGVRMLPFALALAPAALVGAAGGAVIAGAFGLGTIGTMLVVGGLAAILSRPLESAMEAGSQYDDAIARGKTPGEAKKEADEVFRKNMILAGADAWEIGIALAPTPKWVPATLVKRGLVKTATIAGKMAIVGLSEGGEEVYQDMVQRHARGEKWELDAVSKEVFALGALMGMGMGLGGDLVSGVVEKSKAQMSGDLRAVFDKAVAAGKTELQALNDVAGVPQGASLIQTIINDERGELGPKELPALPSPTPITQEAAKPLPGQVEMPAVPSPAPVTPEVKAAPVEAPPEIPKVEQKPPVAPVVKPGEVPPAPPSPPTAEVPPVEPEPKPTPIQNVRAFYKAKIADMKAATSDKIASLKDWQKFTVEEKTRVMSDIIADMKGAEADKWASLKDWQKYSLEEQNRIVREFYEAKIEDLKGVSVDKIASLKDWAKYTVQEQDRVKGILTDYIQETLPLAERGKFLDAVKNIKTQEGLDEVLTRVDIVAEVSAQKTLRTQIEKQLSAAEVKLTKGIPKGKYNAEVQRQLDGITHYLLDNKKAILKSLSSEDLTNALNRIKELRGEGRIARIEKELARQAEMETFRTNVIKSTTGGKGLKPGSETLPSKTLTQNTGIYARVTHPQLAWGTTLNSLDKLSGAAPNQGENSWLGRYATRANETENIGRGKQLDTLRENFSKIFGVTKPKDINNRLRKLSEKLDLGTFKNADGVEVSFKDITKGQIIKKYQEMQDPTLEKTFNEGMKWTPEIRQAFNNALTAEEKAWGDYQMQFLRDYYPSINEVFSRINNVDLPNHEFYTPIAREKELEVEYNLLDPNDMMKFAGVAPGSLKSRVTNIHPLKFTDATQTVVKHITEMEHYKAWAESIRDLRSVYGNPDVRTAIAQYHGKDMIQIIDGFLNDFARGGIDQGHTVKILDTLRTNFATAVIGLKPNIAIQQLPTMFGYLAEMSPKDFAVGVADFWKHPVDNFKWMMEKSPYIKARYQQGFERDIAAALHADTLRQLTGKANVRDVAFALMTSGDKFGVLQGWWATYQRGIRPVSEGGQGLSQVDAMEEANLATDRTQNTSSIDTLSSLQRGGSFWKLLTMFQNQPNKYFRIVFENVENLKYGRGNKFDAIKAIVIAWVVLPAIFQFIADGFQLKKEHQARAVVLGPVNNLLVAGQIVQWLSGRIFGENFDYQATPVIGGLTDVGRAIQNGVTLNAKRLDPFKDVSWDDVIGFVESVAKAGGEIGGLPTPYLIQAEKAIRGSEGKRDLRQLIMSQWALEPPALSLKDKAALAVAGDEDHPGLGMVIPPVSGKEKPLSEKTPPVKDMKKLNTEYGNIFGKTLPSDIGKDFDPLAQLWGKKQISLGNSNILPNVKLAEINTDPNSPKKDTIDTYVKQWQARSQITSLQKLKEFDALYPQAFLGNVTRTQLDLIHRYGAISPDDKAGQTKFKLENPGINIDPREDYLKNNPDENAIQAIFGAASIYSAKAYDKVQALAKEYDIPPSALPEFKDIPTDPDTRDAYFKWQEVVAKFGSDDPEAEMMLAQNDKLHKFQSPGWVADPKKTPAYDGVPVPALQLLADNRDANAKYKLMGDKDKAIFDADPLNKEVADARARVEAYKQQYKYDFTLADKKIVDAWADFKSKGFTATSLGGQLARVDNPPLSTWGETVGPTGEAWQPLTIKSVDALRLKVKNQDRTDIVSKMTTADETAYLVNPKNEEFALDKYRVQGLDAGVFKDQIETYARKELNDKIYTSKNAADKAAMLIEKPAYAVERFTEQGQKDGVPGYALPLYVQIEQAPAKGQAVERLLKENPWYHQNVWIDILHKAPIDFTKVASQNFENFYKDYYLKIKSEREKQLTRMQFIWFEEEGLAIGKFTEPIKGVVKSLAALKLSIQNEPLDVEFSRILEPGMKKVFETQHPDWVKRGIMIEGYNHGVPEQYIPEYVEWKFKPMSEYALQRYMMTHRDFYNQVYKTILGKEQLDFRNVPSVALEAKINIYNDKRGIDKTNYRRRNRDLDLWLKEREKLQPSKATDILGTLRGVLSTVRR